jgi:hypothetical protein
VKRSFARDYDLDASRVVRDANESVGLVMVARRVRTGGSAGSLSFWSGAALV